MSPSVESVNLFRNCVKLTFLTIVILAVVFLPVYIQAADDDKVEMDLKVCVVDENNQPATVITDKGLQVVTVTLVGGTSDFQLKKINGNCLSATKLKPKKSIRLALVVTQSQDPNGVKMTTRFINQNSANKLVDVTVPLKNGVTVIDESGKELTQINPQKSPTPTPSGSPAESPTVVPTVVPTTGFLSENAKDGFSIAMSFFTLLTLGALGVIVFLGWKEKKETKKHLDDSFSEVKQAIEALPALISDAKSETDNTDGNKVSVVLPEQVEPNETKDKADVPETGQVSRQPEASGALSQEPNFNVQPSAPHGTESVRAEVKYKRLLQGHTITYIHLMPISNTSPEQLLAKTIPKKFREGNSGKYIAFPDESNRGYAWVFPAPKRDFDDNTFQFVFPNLSEEDYKNGNISPEKAKLIQEHPDKIWQID